MGGKQGTYGYKGIKLEDKINGPASYLPPFGAEGADDTEPYEQTKEKYLAYSSDKYNIHFSSSSVQKWTISGWTLSK
jgi:hypothetical protein